MTLLLLLLHTTKNSFYYLFTRRYTSASELVNMILAFVETRAYALFQNNEFINLSESMVQMIMSRNLEVSEVKKFEAMLNWARNKVQVSCHHLICYIYMLYHYIVKSKFDYSLIIKFDF